MAQLFSCVIGLYECNIYLQSSYYRLWLRDVDQYWEIKWDTVFTVRIVLSI